MLRYFFRLIIVIGCLSAFSIQSSYTQNQPLHLETAQFTDEFDDIILPNEEIQTPSVSDKLKMAWDLIWSSDLSPKEKYALFSAFAKGQFEEHKTAITTVGVIALAACGAGYLFYGRLQKPKN